MSLVPENWLLVASGEEDGKPVAIVAREKLDVVSRITTWKLVKDGDWRVKQIFFSAVNLGLDRKPNRLKQYAGRGTKLSDSVIDATLRELAENAQVAV